MQNPFRSVCSSVVDLGPTHPEVSYFIVSPSIGKHTQKVKNFVATKGR